MSVFGLPQVIHAGGLGFHRCGVLVHEPVQVVHAASWVVHRDRA